MTHRREPASSYGTEKKIRARENQVRKRKGAEKPKPVSDRSPENRQEPYQAAKEPGQIRSALRRKVEDLVKVARQRGEHRVVGETLEELRDVGDPERALEAGCYLVEPLAKAHVASGDARRDDSRVGGERWAGDGAARQGRPSMEGGPYDRRDPEVTRRGKRRLHISLTQGNGDCQIGWPVGKVQIAIVEDRSPLPGSLARRIGGCRAPTSCSCTVLDLLYLFACQHWLC